MCEVRLGVTVGEVRASASDPEDSPEENCNIWLHRQKNVKLHDDARHATTKRYQGLSRAGFSHVLLKRIAANLEQGDHVCPLGRRYFTGESTHIFLCGHVPGKIIEICWLRVRGGQQLRSPLLAPMEPDPARESVRGAGPAYILPPGLPVLRNPTPPGVIF